MRPHHPDDAVLDAQWKLLGDLLGDTLRELRGPAALERVEGLRRAAHALRAGTLEGGGDALAARVAALSTDELEEVAGAFGDFFHLVNAAEAQHRIRVLRARAAQGPPDGSIAAGCRELAAGGATATDVQALLDRLLVMPVLTAHPTEARRQTVLDHLERVGEALDALDDPRAAGERGRAVEELREAVEALVATRKARASRPTPLDEVRAGLAVFERTLLDAVPATHRALEAALAESWPGHAFRVPAFLRFGTWIGGDRDGNPHVTAEVTRAALERARAIALRRHAADARGLARLLSAEGRGAGLEELERSLEEDRARLPQVAALGSGAHAREPWREKARFVAARLEAALHREEGGYPDAAAHLADLRLLARTLRASGLARLARGRLGDALRRAAAFGFHLATLDVRQHSQVHEAAVDELLAAGGRPGYLRLADRERVALLGELLSRAATGLPRAVPAALSPATRECLDTLAVVARARRGIGPEACERYVVSFCASVSDLLEVLFLARTARLAPDELRPVPLLEQVEDLERAGAIAEEMLQLPPLRAALGGELEVMIGYSDSGKQAGYAASRFALHRAQLALAQVAESHGVPLTVFHGRGGAVGRGGGPANRAIRAQPPAALRGRFRVTEQGETIAARYGRAEIARRDLEQMVNAVLVTSLGAGRAAEDAARAREASAERAASAAFEAYRALLADPERLAAYALHATPIREVMALRIASRPASRSATLRFDDLRAISWNFSWSQSRHGLPAWFGLGAALEALVAAEGVERVRALHRAWPFFRGLVDDARLALVHADLGVAVRYARLAPPEARAVFDVVAAEHARAVRLVREVTGDAEVLGPWPTIARTVARRNPYVDVLSYVQVELLARLRRASGDEEERVREALLAAVNGIAAGLQTVG